MESRRPHIEMFRGLWQVRYHLYDTSTLKERQAVVKARIWASRMNQELLLPPRKGRTSVGVAGRPTPA